MNAVAVCQSANLTNMLCYVMLLQVKYVVFAQRLALEKSVLDEGPLKAARGHRKRQCSMDHI